MEFDALTKFGHVVRAAVPSSIRALALFYPPATGEKGLQQAEAAALAEHGIASLICSPPYIRSPRKGGLRDPDFEIELWTQARREFLEIKVLARKTPLVVIGKNLGGSVASYAIDSSVRALVVTGSVPILSEFWAQSPYPVAAEGRKGLSVDALHDYSMKTRILDLTTTLPSHREISTLVQFGSNDPWIEAEPAGRLEKLASGRQCAFCRFEWLDDDHEMNGPASLAGRAKFIAEALRS